MKKWAFLLVFVGGVAAISMEPSAGKDIGKLQPVQVVCVRVLEGALTLQTDTGNQGQGRNLSEAVEDMRSATSAELFLETADHLLIDQECISLLPQIGKMLRPSCTLCLVNGQPDMEQIGAYLQIHTPKVTLMDYWAEETKLQTLVIIDGRMHLVS